MNGRIIPELPPEWVEDIFKRLSLAYGHRWLGLYAGLDMADVRADWAQELSGFTGKGYAIDFGLGNLDPERPPTAKQFAVICRRAPAPNVARIGMDLDPRKSPAAAAAIAKMRADCAKRAAEKAAP
jgi:hypothetical protein